MSAELTGANRVASLAYRVGAWTVAFIGFAHLLAFGMGRVADAPLGQRMVWAQMERLKVPSPGIEHTLADFYVGNGYGIGVAYLAMGVLGALFERALRRHGFGVPRSAALVSTVATLVSLVIAVLYFPLPPVVFFDLALGAYGVSAVKTRA